MRKSRKLGSKIAAGLLSVLVSVGSLSVSVSAVDIEGAVSHNVGGELESQAQPAAETSVTISPQTDLALGSHAVLVDNDRGGKAVHINTSWVDSKTVDPLEESASFRNPDCFQKSEFTLYMNVYRLENGGNAGKDSKVAFSVGNSDNYFNLRLVGNGSLTGSKISGSADFADNPTRDRAFSSIALSYKEDNVSGKVTVYIDGKKVLDQADVGFKLSTVADVKANIGSGRGTGFMVEGLYDDIRVKDTAVTADNLENVSRYQPYHAFSGVRESYGGKLGNDVKVAEWLDTNGNHIQAHGGQVQWLPTLDLDEDGSAEGGWIWYGEDKTRNGKPIDGIHCYTSADLLNWTDRGMALYTHDMLPDKLNAAGDGIVMNSEGLEKLKSWAQMAAPSADVTAAEIEMAKNFLAAYQTENGYDETNLAKAYKYLYAGYCIAERPKMLYNATTQKYVLVYHADGPSDANILKYLKDNSQFPSRYTRASMGFAVSDTPYGPFKLVNVQRMNYKTGDKYDSNQGMARDMTVFLDDTDINQDGVKDAYAIYSSESNKYMYVSLLNSEYTAPATQETTDSMTLEDGTVVQTFADRVLGTATDKEAPALFKYRGYYYMITSGTSGWRANAASYFRAENIYGPWTSLGDPCEGTSNSTFVSQPTAVIPVDTARGKFIYMGDRWSYTITDDKGNTDSAHWDSSYVWLPINVNEDDTLTIRNVSDWELSALDKPQVNTKLPTVIETIDELPATINVTTDAGTFDTAVIWEDFDKSYFAIKTVTGRMTDLDNREVQIRVAAAPSNMVYFVDAGTEGESGGTFYQLVKDSKNFKNREAADQAYSKEKKWGYVGTNTVQRSSGSLDHYERLRYVQDSSERTLTYQFDDLQAGDYTVYLGFYDPSSWYKEGQRVAKVTLQQKDNVLKSGEVTCGGKGSGVAVNYNGLSLAGTDSLQLSLTPKNTGEGSDMQISWIAIADNTNREPGGSEGPGTPEPTPPNPPGPTQPNPPGPAQPTDKIDISKSAKVTLSQSSYTYSGGRKTPSVTVRIGSKKLKKDSDYTLAYQNNSKVGLASVVVTGKGNYTGAITKTFKINPQGTAISGKIKAQRKGFLVKWKKLTKNVKGYQVQYSTSRKFTKKTTATKSAKKSAVKLNVKGLKANRKYYVRVRVYHTVKGSKYYSGWSKVQSVKTKK